MYHFMKNNPPKRYCHQEWNEVVCIYCTFNNMLQQKVYSKVCDFLKDYEKMCIFHSKKNPLDYYDKFGIENQVLINIFKMHGFIVKKITEKNTNISRGWGIFRLKKNGMKFYHAVAIVNNYVIDSIKNPMIPTGVYPWKGKLLGYDAQKIINLYAIL